MFISARILFIMGVFLWFLGERLYAASTVPISWQACSLLAVLWRPGQIYRLYNSSITQDKRNTYSWLLGGYITAAVMLVLFYVLRAFANNQLGLLCWGFCMGSALLGLLFQEIALQSMWKAKTFSPWRLRRATTSAISWSISLGIVIALQSFLYRYDRKWDLSLWRNHLPLPVTAHLLTQLNEPLDIVAFFPQQNPVYTSILPYLKEAAAQNPRMVHYEQQEWQNIPERAQKWGVRDHGVLVLSQGDRQQSIYLGTHLPQARSTLKQFDSLFYRAVAWLAKGKPHIYWTQGHMEREPVASTQEQRPGVKAFYTMLEQQGWEVHRFSLTEGAQYHVPKQASAVMILGAQAPLRESEWSAIERYLQQGGALFLALDIKNFPPDRNLLEKLHLKLVPGLVTNPRHHLQINPLDDSRPFPMATHLLAPHPSVARLEQYAQQLWVNMLGAGALLADRPPARWHVDFPLRAMPQSYMAHPNNGKFLAQDAEDNYQLVAAIEGPFAAHSSQSARIIVTTDVDMLSDALFDQLGNTYWALDSMNWLLHQDESPQHLPMVSLPEDSPLTHRREHEIGWFYLTSLCLPGCIALIGCISQARKGLLKAG